MRRKPSPSEFLSALRDIEPTLVRACLKGKCFQLYLLLKVAFPEAEPWYDQNHVITKIDGRFWDIRGEVLANQYHSPMLLDPKSFNGAYLWGTDITVNELS